VIDLKILQKSPDLIKEEVKKRGYKIDVDAIIKLDEDRRELITRIDSLKAEKNRVSELIPKLKDQERVVMIEEMKKVSQELKDLEPRLKETEDFLFEEMSKLPNFSHESVPVGPDSSGNVVHSTWGKKPEFGFRPRSHIELGEMLDLVDNERGARTSGARFAYLKKEAVLMEFALVNYTFNILLKKGFVPVVPPVLVKKDAMYGTGFFPAEETEYYSVKFDDLYLVGTAEVSLCSLHMSEIFSASSLPLRYAGFSSCFRREAGSYGKDLGGIFRVHQFDKVEMFIFCKEEDSWEEYELLRTTMEEIMQGLGFHYRVMNMCTGDIGAPNAKKYDLEVWFPFQQNYRELVSCSNDTDFQARRLNIRYKEKGRTKFVHTMNSTACAIGRTLIAIFENYQQEDGTIIIPDVLKPYLGGKEKIPFLPG
jgi:seryl-tRNA synthetase